MKKIVCESCGDVNLIKEGDLYICPSCGSQYFTEELYSNQKQININVNISSDPGQAAQAARYLTLALKAYHAKDIREAGKYAQMVLELDLTVSMAWFLKGVDTGYAATLSNNRCKEAIDYFEQALKYSNPKELEFYNDEIPEVMTEILIAYASLYKSLFAQEPSQDHMKLLIQCQEEIESYDKVLQKSCGVGLREYRTRVTGLINSAVCTAYRYVIAPEYKRCFESGSRPNYREVQIYMDRILRCCELERMIIKQPVENKQDNIQYCNNLIMLLESLESIKTYKRSLAKGVEWDSITRLHPKQQELVIDEIMQCHLKIKEYDPKYIVPARPKRSCYIATAVYGTYDCAEVWTLRRYRDQVLANSLWGRIFIAIYYKISPKVVALFGRNRMFLSWSKRWLDDLVERLKCHGFEDTPYLDQ